MLKKFKSIYTIVSNFVFFPLSIINWTHKKEVLHNYFVFVNNREILTYIQYIT